MARELSLIVKELESALTEMQTTRDTLTKAENVMKDAAVKHKNAQDTASALKAELDAVFSGFVNQSQQRVRQS